jgi:N-acetylglucosamine-6-sulfatase
VYFSQYLQKAGYATGFIGKWHMGGESDQPQPGWDHWVSFRGQGEYLPPTPDCTLNVDGERVRQKGYITTELTDYAIDWLNRQKPDEKPFFLYLSHKAVHANFTPEPKYEDSIKDLPFTRPVTEAGTPGNLLRPRWLRDQRNSWHGVDFPYHSELDIERYYKRYCEALRSVDDSIGRVLQQLKDMGVYDETLEIYMGDNGFMFGEHGLIDKRVAYETSMRVPMLVQCPGLIKGGTVVNEMIANIDVAPTIMEAMGLKTHAHMDGDSFMPLAAGKAIPWRKEFLYVYYWVLPRRRFHHRVRRHRPRAAGSALHADNRRNLPLALVVDVPLAGLLAATGRGHPSVLRHRQTLLSNRERGARPAGRGA